MSCSDTPRTSTLEDRTILLTLPRRAEKSWMHGGWQREVPCFHVLSSPNCPRRRRFEKFFSIEGKGDELRLTTRYSTNGSRRKLTMVVLPPPDFKLPDNSARPQNELQQDKANGFSETRIVVIGGKILASQGWTVASDKRSALLSVDEIARFLRNSPDRIELFIEWDVTGA